MRTIIMCMLKGVLFIVAMLAICVLFGEPNDAMSLNDVIVIKAIAFLAMVGAFKGYMLTLSKRELEELTNE